MPNKLSLGSRLSIGAANTIARLGGGFEVQRDIEFDAQHHLNLDWYRSDACSKNCPLIVFFYGGGWMGGDKSQYLFVAQAMTARGYHVVIPNYRLYPQVKFPDFMSDAAKAVAYVHQHQAQWQVSNIFVMGHSAGGHMAAMIATDPQYLAQQQLTPKVITAVAGIAGGYSFNPAETDYLAVFAHMQNTPEGFAPMQVDTLVQGGEPPMFLLTGSADVTVRQINTDKLAAALNRVHSPVTLKQYPDLNHTQMISVFVKPLRHRAPVVADIDAFFKRVKIKGE